MKCIICGSDRPEIKKFEYKKVVFSQCRECGLIKTVPFPSISVINKYYKEKAISGNYEILKEKIYTYMDVYLDYLRLLENQVDINGKKILDIGCFTGDFLYLAQKKGAIPFGIELQEEACEIAKNRTKGNIQNCFFEDANFDFKFDIITMFGLIEHVTNPDKLIQKTYEWLSSPGILIIQTPNTNSIFSRLLGKYWPPYEPIEHIHYFSEKNIQLFLEKYGFDNVIIARHSKKLTIEYVFNMLKNFGLEFYRIFYPIYKILPKRIKRLKLNFYCGEMICIGIKK